MKVAVRLERGSRSRVGSQGGPPCGVMVLHARGLKRGHGSGALKLVAKGG
jgi:hypothetical protein